MPRYGKRSKEVFSELCQELQEVFSDVIQLFDHSLVEGFRGEKKQNYYYSLKLSDLKWPYGKHNKKPSDAVDAYPYDKKGKCLIFDKTVCAYFAGLVIATGLAKGYTIRWGGDFNRNQIIMEKSRWEKDLGHFEIVRT